MKKFNRNCDDVCATSLRASNSKIWKNSCCFYAYLELEYSSANCWNFSPWLLERCLSCERTTHLPFPEFFESVFLESSFCVLCRLTEDGRQFRIPRPERLCSSIHSRLQYQNEDSLSIFAILIFIKLRGELWVVGPDLFPIKQIEWYCRQN